MRWIPVATLLAVSLAVTACGHEWDPLDPRLASGGAAAASAQGGSSSGGSSSGGNGGNPSAGGGGSGGAPGWLAPDHERRRILTVTNAQNEELVGFPLLIALDSTRIDYGVAQMTGDDLRFFDSEGMPVDYDIDTWDAAATSVVWLRAPALAASGTTNLSMYYGDPNATPAASANAVWSDYQAVWHMGVFDDSTGNFDGTNGGTGGVAGMLGGARGFDGAGDYVAVGNPAGLSGMFAGGATVSAWIRAYGWGGNGFGRIIDRSSGGTGQTGWLINVFDSSHTLGFRRDFTTTGGNWSAPMQDLTLNTWHHIAIVYDDTTSRPAMFIDGKPRTVTASTTPVGMATPEASTTMYIGNRATAADRGFEGVIDEVRIGPSRSAAWLSAQNTSMRDQMVSYGAEQTRP